MPFSYDKQLFAILPDIEESLVARTPEAVKALHIPNTAYAIFLWYHDSSTCGDLDPYFGVGVESVRGECFKKYDDPISAIDCLWRPQQVVAELVKQDSFNDSALAARCNDAYSLMLAANTSGLPLPDEGEILTPFRQMMHRVAQRLNGIAWENVLPTTDDFVVVSMDSIGYWLAEDLKSSIPERKYATLLQRSLLLESA